MHIQGLYSKNKKISQIISDVGESVFGVCVCIRASYEIKKIETLYW